MNAIATLFVEVLAVIAVILLFQFTVLLYRNPHRSKWFRSELLQTTVVVGLVTLITLSMGILVAGLISAGVNMFAALGISAALPLVTAVVSARIFGLRERLRRAEAGESPFYAITRTDDRKPTSRFG